MTIRHIMAVLLLTLPIGVVTAAPAKTVVVQGPSGQQATLTASDLAQLPSVHTTVTDAHRNGQVGADGPLLWVVLTRSGVLKEDGPRTLAGQAIRIEGVDGYGAVLGMGEIAPGFENKPVALALRLDGKPASSGMPRLVVPGEQRGARSVRDVVRVVVLTPR